MKEVKIESIKDANLSPEEIAEFDQMIEQAEKEIEEKQLCSCANCDDKRKTKPVTLRISEGDIERCKRIAEKKGLPYQTYLKSVIKQALDKDDAA